MHIPGLLFGRKRDRISVWNILLARKKPICIYSNRMFAAEADDCEECIVYGKEMNKEKKMNCFKKLLRKEFGAGRYQQFAEYVEKYIGPEVEESKELFNTIYQYCNCLDSEKILGMQARLNETLYSAFKVGKTYMMSFLLFIMAWLYVLCAQFPTEVLLPAIGVLCLGFGLKTWQFFANRCFYVDARIIETYRQVLERILIKRAREGRKQE